MLENDFWTFLEHHTMHGQQKEYDELCLVFADFCEENDIPAHKALKLMSGKDRVRSYMPVRSGNWGWLAFGNRLILPNLIYSFLPKKRCNTLKELVLDLNIALERLSQIL